MGKRGEIKAVGKERERIQQNDIARKHEISITCEMNCNLQKKVNTKNILYGKRIQKYRACAACTLP
jgi:hypothetical protein